MDTTRRFSTLGATESLIIVALNESCLFRISLGISKGDGTLHMSFDQHDNPLNYRVSRPGVATHPLNIEWSAELFGPILVIFHEL